MGVLSWLRKSEATVPELKEQVTAAEAEHERAQAALATAKDAFDADGSEKSLKFLHAATEAASHAALHLDRAQRLLERGEARDAEEQRRVLLECVTKAERDLEDALARERPLIEREADLLRQLLAVREERCTVLREAEAFKLPMERAYYNAHKLPCPNTYSFIPSAGPVRHLLNEERKNIKHSNWGPIYLDNVDTVMPGDGAYNLTAYGEAAK